jgi:hypothetical protein
LTTVSPNDPFSGTVLDSNRWFDGSSNGASISQDDGLVATVRDGLPNSIASANSVYQLAGDFDIQVDWSIGPGWSAPMWDETNGPIGPHLGGAALQVNTGEHWGHITRARSDYYGPPSPPYPASDTHDGFLAYSPDCINPYGWCSYVDSSTLGGEYRIVRSGAALNYFYNVGSGWQLLYSGSFPTSPVSISLSAGSGETRFAFTSYFEHYVVNSGTIYGEFRASEHDFERRVLLHSLSVNAALPNDTSVSIELHAMDTGSTDWTHIGTYTFTPGTGQINLPAGVYAEKVKYGVSGTNGIRLSSTADSRPILHGVTLRVS